MPELTKIQHEIHDCLEKFQSLKVVESHLDEINKQLSTANKKLSQLDKEVNKELADWEALEGKGVKSIFYKVLGSKEQQIEKERQEYLEVSLKYNEFKKSVELMEFEQKVLKKKTGSIATLEKKIVELKQLREKEILADDNIVLKNQYEELLQRMDANRLIKKELEEAIFAGKTAFGSLKKTRAHLNQAIQWGQWDMGSRKGGMSAHMKHGAIDKANASASRAQHELRMFQRELQDINNGSIEFDFKMEGFSRFTDFFFDNLISDWIIQQKIKNSLSSVESVMDRVSRLVGALDHELKIVHQEFNDLDNNRNQLLLK